MSHTEDARPSLSLVWHHEVAVVIATRGHLHEGLDSVAFLVGDWLFLEEGASTLTAAAQFVGAGQVEGGLPNGSASCASDDLAHEYVVLHLCEVNDLVHEGFDEVALVSCVGHRANVEHEGHLGFVRASAVDSVSVAHRATSRAFGTG